MKKLIELIDVFFENNKWIAILLNIQGLIQILIWFLKMIINLINTANSGFKIWNTSFPLHFYHLEIFIVSIILYFILRAFYGMRKQVENSNKHWFNQISNVASELTTNLNDVNYTCDLKMRYNALWLLYQNKSIDEFIKKINSDGFSLEDLQKIGVDENFIKQNKDKLYPKSVMDKYKEFKIELEKQKEKRKDESNRNIK